MIGRDIRDDSSLAEGALTVPAMGSDHCVGIAHSSMEHLAGVSAILTNIADYRVTVTTPVDGPDANKLRAAVEDAGHDVTLVETEREDGQIDDAAIDEAYVKYAARSES